MPDAMSHACHQWRLADEKRFIDKLSMARLQGYLTGLELRHRDFNCQGSMNASLRRELRNYAKKQIKIAKTRN